jgi:6-phosphogluconolactonase
MTRMQRGGEVMEQVCRWHIYPSAAELTTRAVRAVAGCAQQAIAARGAFRIVLAGGGTPRNVYAALRNADTAWESWHVYFGDERCVPPADAGRNDRMAAEALLDHVPVPAAQVHGIPAELGAEAAAAAYGRILGGVDLFDLVLLGLGEDGHTASLFPGRDPGASASAPDVLAVHDAPKPPPDRVSLSARRLSRAREVLFLVTGAGKRAALLEWRALADIPARSIRPRDGVDLFADADAAADWLGEPTRDERKAG